MVSILKDGSILLYFRS